MVAAAAGLTRRAQSPPIDYGEQQQVETANANVCLHTLLENEVSESKILRSLELVREMGASSIVQFFPWPYFQPEPGAYRWERADLLISAARRQGLRVIARLGLAPAWARAAAANSTLTYLPETAYDEFANFAAAFAERYKSQVERLIIWNEPNLRVEWGQRPVDPAAYVRLLEASYRSIKGANPTAVVLAGALAPTLEPPGSAAGLNDIAYLRDMYRHGAQPHFDALAIHSYGFREPPEAEPGVERLNFRRAELLREVMLAHGDERKAVYITEAGWNDHPRWTGAVRPSQRAAYSVRAFEYAREHWRWAESLCIWALRYPADLGNYPDYSTLLSADFIKKPIYFALQDYARGWQSSEALWLPPPHTG